MVRKIVPILLIFFAIPALLLSQTGDWAPPIFSERQNDCNEMVEEQLIPRNISDHEALNAMRSTITHLLVLEHNRSLAYSDNPLPIGRG